MVNRVSSYFQKGGHSAIETELKIILTRVRYTFMTLYNMYLNAKVSQHLLKCEFLLFDPNISLGDTFIEKSHGLPFIQHEIRTMRLMVAELQQKSKVTPCLKVTEFQYLIFYSKRKVTNPYILFVKDF